jgi:hypothetical protein
MHDLSGNAAGVSEEKCESCLTLQRDCAKQSADVMPVQFSSGV